MNTRILDLLVCDAPGTLVRLALAARRFGGAVQALTVTTDPATGAARMRVTLSGDGATTARIAAHLSALVEVHAIMH
jgi:acetolactate synthase small subunit